VATGSVNNDIFIIKTDGSGNVQWAKTYGGGANDNSQAIVSGHNGGYVITGTTYSFGGSDPDALALKVDNSGNIEWVRIYGGSENDSGKDIAPTNDGGYVITGRTASFGQGNNDIYVIKIDSVGNSGCNETSVSFTVQNYSPSVSSPNTVTNNGGSTGNANSVAAPVTWPDTLLCPLSCPPVNDLWTSNLCPNRATLNWSAVPDAHHYIIRGKKVGSFNWVTLNVTGTSKPVQNLDYNTRYEWQIMTACDAQGNNTSGWSKLDTFRTACYPPDSAWTSNVTCHTARLNWLPGACANKYELWGGPAGASGWVRMAVSGVTQFAGGLQPNTTYEWKVRTHCDELCYKRSVFTPLATFTTPSCNSSDAALRKQGDALFSFDAPTAGPELAVYPNPADDQLMIEITGLPASQPATLRLANLHGRTVINEKVEGADGLVLYKLNVRDMPNGIYQLIVMDEETLSVKKVVIAR